MVFPLDGFPVGVFHGSQVLGSGSIGSFRVRPEEEVVDFASIEVHRGAERVTNRVHRYGFGIAAIQFRAIVIEYLHVAARCGFIVFGACLHPFCGYLCGDGHRLQTLVVEYCALQRVSASSWLQDASNAAAANIMKFCLFIVFVFIRQ